MLVPGRKAGLKMGRVVVTAVTKALTDSKQQIGLVGAQAGDLILLSPIV